MPQERAYFGVEGLHELKKLLSVDSILGAEWKRTMEQIRDYGADQFRYRIPDASGKSKRSIRPQIQAKAVPMWARVKFDVKAVPNPGAGKGGAKRPQNPFRVLGALEGGGRYHYSSDGGKTKGWWSTSIENSQKRAQQLVNTATKGIEQRFSKWRGVIWLSHLQKR